jgi:diguanylate cyclase (GGDEF)-like protein
MVWNGARLFQERRVLPLPMFAGAIIWLVAWSDPHFVANSNDHVVLSALIISAYTFMTAFEFWRERRKPMFSHWSAVLVPALHAGVFLFPIPFAMLGPVSLGPSLFSSGWFMLFAFETLLYAVGSACMMLLMTSERTAQMHKTAALTDPLTTLFNRRGFFEGAERLLAERTRKQRPVTVLMFDLDHFKSINDRFGHGVGDEALRIFGVTVAATMRTGDVVARLGGEEFAAILPSSLAEATMAAERVRVAFLAAGATVSGHSVGATVSIGAATAPAGGVDLGRLLGAADHALYRAKHAGRNRIEGEEIGPVEPASLPPGNAPNLVPDPVHSRTRSSDHANAAA